MDKSTLAGTWCTPLALSALFVLLLLLLAGRAAAAPDLSERLQACTACHGEQGGARRDGYVPRIAGKPAGYLEQQLLNFRDGRRAHRGMAYLLENLSDDYLREIAAHFAAQRPPTVAAAAQPALSAQQTERARQLVQRGDAARRLPACAACHGAPLGGIQPGVPGLTGLPADYLIAQLGAWRSDKRRAREPDCMAQIAKALPEAELAWVARWLAAQPPGEPLPTPPPRWPMDCGGVTR